MDSSPFRNFPDLGPIFVWAMVGMILSGIAVLTVLSFAIWWAVHHIQFV